MITVVVFPSPMTSNYKSWWQIQLLYLNLVSQLTSSCATEKCDLRDVRVTHDDQSVLPQQHHWNLTHNKKNKNHKYKKLMMHEHGTLWISRSFVFKSVEDKAVNNATFAIQDNLQEGWLYTCLWSYQNLIRMFLYVTGMCKPFPSWQYYIFIFNHCL